MDTIQKYIIRNTELAILGEIPKIVRLPHTIYKVVECHNYLIVMLKWGKDLKFNENIFGVSWEGKIVWQIAPVKYIRPSSPFTDIGCSDNGFLEAYNWNGFLYTLDPETGKILKEEFVK